MTNANFDQEKAVEGILYLANRLGTPDTHSICRVFYHADRYNLERYGQSIAGDCYCAMEFGPVPSGAYDLLTERDDLGFRKDGLTVMPSRDADTDWLSKADVESLDRAIETHQHAEAPHGEAWQEAWSRRGDKRSVEMPMELVIKGLEDADLLLDYLQGRP